MCDEYDTYEKALCLNRLIAEVERLCCKDSAGQSISVSPFDVYNFIRNTLKEIRETNAANLLRPTVHNVRIPWVLASHIERAVCADCKLQFPVTRLTVVQGKFYCSECLADVDPAAAINARERPDEND